MIETIDGFASAYPALSKVARDPDLTAVAQRLVGMDGRGIRKLVTEAMLSRVETTMDPGCLTVSDIDRVSLAWHERRMREHTNEEVGHAAR